jgi:8-oxo-dGTP pyrophosphatase MutT (NUDIX family)
VTTPLPTGDALRTLIQRHLAAFDRREAGAELRRAAVAVTLLDLDTTPSVLVLKRAARGLNPGQWALPGGKLEPGEDAVAAALRELAEEAGVHAAPDTVAGRLDDYVTDSGFCITPVVVLAPAGARPERNEREIQSLHPVALTRLLAPHVPRWQPLPGGERLLQMPLRHDMVVHAPTGAILLQFREVALRGAELRIADLVQPEWTRR